MEKIAGIKLICGQDVSEREEQNQDHGQKSDHALFSILTTQDFLILLNGLRNTCI